MKSAADSEKGVTSMLKAFDTAWPPGSQQTICIIKKKKFCVCVRKVELVSLAQSFMLSFIFFIVLQALTQRMQHLIEVDI